jgi:hypothetical protein
MMKRQIQSHKRDLLMRMFHWSGRNHSCNIIGFISRILGNLIHEKLIDPADLDPLGKRFFPYSNEKNDVVCKNVNSRLFKLCFSRNLRHCSKRWPCMVWRRRRSSLAHQLLSPLIAH